MSKWLIVLLLIPSLTFANYNPPLTWAGALIAQFYPTIVKALLGNGYALLPTQAFFGDCSDGDVTISAGTTTLARDMFYNNLTMSGTGVLNFANQRVFVCRTLDLTAAQAGALDDSGNNGGNGTAGGTGGGGGNNVAVGTNINGRSGANGGAGSTTTGATGAQPTAGNCISNASGGSGGAGGAGSAGAGGNQKNQNVVTNFPMRDITFWFLATTGSGVAVQSAGAGSGGAGGGGDNTTSGGGGGGGGAGGSTIYLSANIVKTGVSTVAGTITSNGGKGGNGGSTAAGNTGSGGGGGGGGGGWLVLKYNAKVGASVTNLIQTLAGAGGNAGTPHGTGASGAAGNAQASSAGLIQVLDTSTGLISTSTSGSFSL